MLDDTYKLYRKGVELLEDGSFGEATVPLAEVARRASNSSAASSSLPS